MSRDAKRKLFICFHTAETVLLVCRTFKTSPYTESHVNQGREIHLNLIYLTMKANTSKGGRKKWGNGFLHAEETLWDICAFTRFFFPLCYCSLKRACYCSGNESSKQIFIAVFYCCVIYADHRSYADHMI